MAKSLPEKMRLKPNQCAAILNAPDQYAQEFQPIPEGATIDGQLDGAYDWIQVFVKNSSELQAIAPGVIEALEPEGLLWLSFPKGSSKMQTDLTRDRGWEALKDSDLKWVTLVSVNDTWSAFYLRPYKPGEERQTFR